MTDCECVALLQWALPRLRMRWRGFRRVRGQVCKRVARRLWELGLAGAPDYRHYLDAHPQEWPVLDGLCGITISRFYRDPAVFDALGPLLEALARDNAEVRAWSIGCAAGEEPYSVRLVWAFRVQPRWPTRRLVVLGTDYDEVALQRARLACYPPSSLKALPGDWRALAFSRVGDQYCLGREHRADVRFARQDIRRTLPEQDFHLILCRNLVLTYFEAELQSEVLARVLTRLSPGGALVIGRHEALPPGTTGLAPWHEALGIYRRVA